MAVKRKRPNRSKNKHNKVPTKNIIGLIYLLVALLGYSGKGFIGVFVANMFRILVGNLSPILFVLLFFYGVYLFFMGREPFFEGIGNRMVGFSITFLGCLLWIEYGYVNNAGLDNGFVSQAIRDIEQSFVDQSIAMNVGGGVGGALFYSLTHFLFSSIGSAILAIILVLTGIIMIFGIPFRKLMESIGVGTYTIFSFLHHNIKRISQAFFDWYDGLDFDTAEKEYKPKPIIKETTKERIRKPSKEEPIVDGTSGTEHPISPKIEIATDHIKKRHTKNNEDNLDIKDETGFHENDHMNPNYRLPSSSLLTEIPSADQSSEYSSIKKNTKILQDTLNSFGVDATVESVKMGPSVTEYEIHPAIGVKVSKIVGLTDDLALALAAKDIRIEAPIPGKSLVGIEVPNKAVSTVSFRDIIESQPPHPDDLLKVPIGRDVSGNLVEADLVKMQHLLIAGATGSGKSVMINVIITGLLMNARPDEVKLILIDPKKVELGIYNDIPHLLTPVVTDARKAAKALHKVVAEMQQRYDLFAEMHQRNIKSYNEFIEKQNKADGQKRPKMPYIVVVVDELADLMMVASNEVEDAIIRLAQLARAAGIHMIIATQRPSVDVVTGLIKANVPSRIAFAVASGTDSRTIIDTNGAEKLLGRGDMLFFPMGKNKPERVQGAFISDHDVQEVVDFVKQQQQVEYDDELQVSDQDLTESPSDDLDEYYDEAVDLVVDMQKASTSLLQRKFRIGYNRAARLMDQLEDNGIIGPQEGSKPRKVYKEK